MRLFTHSKTKPQDLQDIALQSATERNCLRTISFPEDCASISTEASLRCSLELMNCFSNATGRPLYPCKAGASLQKCLKRVNKDDLAIIQLWSSNIHTLCENVQQQQFFERAQKDSSILETEPIGIYDDIDFSSTTTALAIGILESSISTINSLKSEQTLVSKELTRLQDLLRDQNEALLSDLKNFQADGNELGSDIQTIVALSQQTASRQAEFVADQQAITSNLEASLISHLSALRQLDSLMASVAAEHAAVSACAVEVAAGIERIQQLQSNSAGVLGGVAKGEETTLSGIRELAEMEQTNTENVQAVMSEINTLLWTLSDAVSSAIEREAGLVESEKEMGDQLTGIVTMNKERFGEAHTSLSTLEQQSTTNQHLIDEYNSYIDSFIARLQARLQALLDTTFRILHRTCTISTFLTTIVGVFVASIATSSPSTRPARPVVLLLSVLPFSVNTLLVPRLPPSSQHLVLVLTRTISIIVAVVVLALTAFHQRDVSHESYNAVLAQREHLRLIERQIPAAYAQFFGHRSNGMSEDFSPSPRTVDRMMSSLRERDQSRLK
ncbi:hypothetical protein BLNAU_20458 [Blattamonas nauphoetae]|uniref:Uncharacterized protein n=1 Tax=Blattamonas nauphoetae TaxID=2049346 RepID=A0ABQ9WYJ5_9EUKA|nr:hypothetical protein BLNAU_20458 [Blattamonas nauphoetae]